MSTSPASARRQGVLAGIVTFAVISLPTVGVLVAAQSGSVGTVPSTGLGTLAVIVLGSISIGTGYLVARAYARDPQRRPGDVWSTWFTGFVTLVLGACVAPLVVLFVYIDSDHALDDRLPAVFGTWTAIHLVIAGLALYFARGLLNPPDETSRVEMAEKAG